MAENSKIEWTDHTFNPWIGCTKVHEGCRNCYAETLMDSRYGKAQWGPSGNRVLTSDSNWRKPLKWNRDAAKAGVRARVFCASLADVFEDWTGRILYSNGWTVHRGQPWHYDKDLIGIQNLNIGHSVATMQDVRNSLFKLIDTTPHLDWLILTKRPENIQKMWSCPQDPHISGGCYHSQHRNNVWLGTSISTQEHAEKQIPELLKCHDLASNLFLSIEPMLGPIQLDVLRVDDFTSLNCLDGMKSYAGRGGRGGSEFNTHSSVDWVIVGGESGHGARPMHPDWVRAIRDECVEAGVPFHFKQWGEWVPCVDLPTNATAGAWITSDGRRLVPLDGIVEFAAEPMHRAGKNAAGRMLDGRTWDEFPVVL